MVVASLFICNCNHSPRLLDVNLLVYKLFGPGSGFDPGPDPGTRIIITIIIIIRLIPVATRALFYLFSTHTPVFGPIVLVIECLLRFILHTIVVHIRRDPKYPRLN